MDVLHVPLLLIANLTVTIRALVISQLTERCRRTIIGALALRLGAIPAGIEGTEKTDSTKDLSKGLAI